MRTCEKFLAAKTRSLANHITSKRTTVHLQAQRNISIAILVILLKHIRHALQANARLDEQVEAEGVAAVAVIGAVQQRDKLLRQAVSKRNQRLVELRIRYAAAVILVEAIEQSAPRRQETPKAAGKVKKKQVVSWRYFSFGGERGGKGKEKMDKSIPELVKVDGARLVGIEHSNHHAYGMRIKRRPVAVYERGAQLSLCQLTTSYRNG